MIVVGLDVSLNGTGGARLDTETGAVRFRRFDPKGRRGHDRIEWTRTEIVEFIRGADLAVIEGLALGAKSSSLDEIYGHHKVICHEVWRRRIPHALASPADLKGYLTGNGQAQKLELMRELRATFPGLLIPSEDEGDALGLATMGCRWKNQIVDAHRTRFPHVLDKVRWPDQDGEPRAIVRKKTPRSPLARPRFSP